MLAQEHSFEFSQNHIYLTAQVNGKPAHLVFDTGSSDVYLDSTWLAESSVKYSQMGKAMVRGAGNETKPTVIVFSGVSISLGGKQYSPQMVPVIDLRAVLGDMADGIFGLGQWKGKIITVDYKNRNLSVSDKLTAAQTAGFSRITIQTDPNHPGQILVPVEVTVSPDKIISGKALLDLGAGGGLEFTSKTATKFGLDKLQDKSPFYYKHGGVGGESAGFEFKIGELKIGGIPVPHGRARYSTDRSGAMASDVYVAIIGNEIWHHFTLIIDLQESMLYLKEER
jgi:hypothetical protein